MGNIVGEGFPSEITKQVEVRQKVYGSGYGQQNRSPEELIYLTNNTAWCKLVSSTDIDDITKINNFVIKNLDPSLLRGNTLAKNFILFNGTSAVDDNGNIVQRAGIDLNRGLTSSDKAYGLGGTDFGTLPMPGIISATIKHKNRGSIRTATVKIKAWNRIQFEIIDVLYLRLGFSVLLEWGNSMYFDNNSQLQRSNPDISLVNEFLKGNSYLTMLSLIQEKRLKTFGNYEAMFGKVTNFHWSFQKDGSYDITLDLVSIGDVIESFKSNQNNYIQPSNKKAPDSKFELYEKASHKNSIAAFLYRYFVLESEIFGKKFSNPDIPDLYDYKWDSTVDNRPNPPINKDVLQISNSNTTSYDYYYIRLGCLLEFFQNGLMYNIKGKNSSIFDPLLKFDFETDKNIMGILKIDSRVNPEWPNEQVINQTSYDPSICIVRKQYPNIPLPSAFPLYSSINGNPIIPAGFDSLPGANDFEFKIGDNWYGKIMNIYINFDFILNKIDSSIDESTEKISLVNLLKGILEGVNGAMGGVNDLDAVIDETTNTVKIIDKNPYPSLSSVLSHFSTSPNPLSTAEFQLYGYNSKSNEAGFIRNFSLTTELTPEFSNMITAGATANGTVVGEDATALSKLNKGLTDRYKNNISSPIDTTTSGIIALTPEQKYIQAAYNYDSAPSGQYNPNSFYNFLAVLATFQFTQDDISNFKTNFPNVLRYWYRYLNNLGIETPSDKTGFIPFNLSITIEGLSGMKIYQRFNVNADFMPSNYPSSVEFLIKNIEHKVEHNKWTTTLESFSISKSSQGKLPTTAGVSSTSLPSACGPSNVVSISSINNLPRTPFNVKTNTSDATNKLLTSLFNIFGSTNGVDSKCARFVYNIAKIWIDSINKSSPPEKVSTPGNYDSLPYKNKGNAKDSTLREALYNLGYTSLPFAIGQNLTESEAISLINSIPYQIGDIIIYWANKGQLTSGPVAYGHIQIYQGGAYKNPLTLFNTAGSKFTSSHPGNYANNPNDNFVYGGYENKGISCWEIWYLKAPETNTGNTVNLPTF